VLERKGKAINLTQSNILETTIVLESNLGNHGVIKRHVLPQNHGHHLRKTADLNVSNCTTKKTLEGQINFII